MTSDERVSQRIRALERAWERIAAPISRTGRHPGVRDQELDQAADSLGLSLPEELCAWWRHHDGEPAHRAQAMVPSFGLLSLAGACEATQSMRDRTADFNAQMQDEAYHQFFSGHWLVLSSTPYGGALVADCSGRATAAIYETDPYETNGTEPPVKASVCDLLDGFLACFENDWIYVTSAPALDYRPGTPDRAWRDVP